MATENVDATLPDDRSESPLVGNLNGRSAFQRSTPARYAYVCSPQKTLHRWSHIIDMRWG